MVVSLKVCNLSLLFLVFYLLLSSKNKLKALYPSVLHPFYSSWGLVFSFKL